MIFEPHNTRPLWCMIIAKRNLQKLLTPVPIGHTSIQASAHLQAVPSPCYYKHINMWENSKGPFSWMVNLLCNSEIGAHRHYCALKLCCVT